MDLTYNDSISCSTMIYHIDGYNAFHSTDNGRGVLIYAKDTYNISPNQYLNSLYHDATWCDWTLDNKTVIVGCIYRSPSDNHSPGPKAKTGDLPYTALRQRFDFIFM